MSHSTDPLMNAALEQDAAYLQAMGADPGATLEGVGLTHDTPAGQAQPDKYCVTTPDGDCVSTDPRCMHQPAGETVDMEATRAWAEKWLYGGPLSPSEMDVDNLARALLAETRRADAERDRADRFNAVADERTRLYHRMQSERNVALERADAAEKNHAAVLDTLYKSTKASEVLAQRVTALEAENARLREQRGRNTNGLIRARIAELPGTTCDVYLPSVAVPRHELVAALAPEKEGA